MALSIRMWDGSFICLFQSSLVTESNCKCLQEKPSSHIPESHHKLQGCRQHCKPHPSAGAGVVQLHVHAAWGRVHPGCHQDKRKCHDGLAVHDQCRLLIIQVTVTALSIYAAAVACASGFRAQL